MRSGGSTTRIRYCKMRRASQHLPAEPERELAGQRSEPRRRDSRESRRKLLDATGRLLADGPLPRSIEHVAIEAGLSAATAYRHFASLDDLLRAYAHQTILTIADFAAEQTATGAELLRIVTAEWIRVTKERGPAMVQLRSRRGWLARREEGDPIIRDTCLYLEPAVRGIIDEEGLSEEALEVGLFLWNITFDPREILDLMGTLGWRDDQVLDRLLRLFHAGMRAAVEDAEPARARRRSRTRRA
jgi:AcrR family transcriptional regulator